MYAIIKKKRSMHEMKKNKIFSFIAICILCITTLISCKKDEYSYESFYGVIKWSEECERLVVYIPDIGDIEIPSSERTVAGFDGYGPNENYEYELKEGDLVAISFKYRKAWDDDGVRIMESYPARFDRTASSIEALAENIKFEKTDGGYELSFFMKDEDNFKKDDKIYFYFHGGKNGAAYKQLIAEGTVIDVTQKRLTASLSIIIPEKEFLEKFTSISIE